MLYLHTGGMAQSHEIFQPLIHHILSRMQGVSLDDEAVSAHAAK
jgi:hypothetical protein